MSGGRFPVLHMDGVLILYTFTRSARYRSSHIIHSTIARPIPQRTISRLIPHEHSSAMCVKSSHVQGRAQTAERRSALDYLMCARSVQHHQSIITKHLSNSNQSVHMRPLKHWRRSTDGVPRVLIISRSAHRNGDGMIVGETCRSDTMEMHSACATLSSHIVGDSIVLSTERPAAAAACTTRSTSIGI